MDEYSAQTIHSVEQMLGYGITSCQCVKTFRAIDGVIYTDLFEGDVVIPSYSGKIKKAFNGRSNGTCYYNQIILEGPLNGDIELDLRWGSDAFYDEIDGLLELVQNNQAVQADDIGIAAKKIEDFSVSYRSGADKSADTKQIIVNGWSYYIRTPVLIGISRDNRHDYRYF